MQRFIHSIDQEANTIGLSTKDDLKDNERGEPKIQTERCFSIPLLLMFAIRIGKVRIGKVLSQIIASRLVIVP